MDVLLFQAQMVNSSSREAWWHREICPTIFYWLSLTHTCSIIIGDTFLLTKLIWKPENFQPRKMFDKHTNDSCTHSRHVGKCTSNIRKIERSDRICSSYWLHCQGMRFLMDSPKNSVPSFVLRGAVRWVSQVVYADRALHSDTGTRFVRIPLAFYAQTKFVVWVTRTCMNSAGPSTAPFRLLCFNFLHNAAPNVAQSHETKTKQVLT